MNLISSQNTIVGSLKSWDQFSQKHELGDEESVYAATILAFLVLSSNNNSLAKNILSKWLEGNNSDKFWETIKPIFPSTLLSEGKHAFLSLSQEVRKSLYHFILSHIKDPAGLFGMLRNGCSTEEEIKRKGMIFTPPALANYVTREAIMHWKRLHRKGSMPKLIGDISCGPGAFLLPIQEIFGNTANIIGVDSDFLSIEFSRILCMASGNNWKLECYDPLLKEVEGNREGQKYRKYDLLIGNPPYIRSQLLDYEYKLRLKKSYPDIVKGNYDLSILFIDHALRTLKTGGIASYILSNKFMTSSYGKNICQKLSTEARLINLTDFFDTQLFPGRTTYTCVLTFANLPPASRFTVNNVLDSSGSSLIQSPTKSFTLATQRLREHPWDFATGLDFKILKKLRDKKHPLLTDVFKGILQGVRTGANNIFVLKGSDAKLEKPLLRKFVSGSEIRACRVNSEKKVLLFPYRENIFGLLEPYPEDEFKSGYPMTWNYLVAKKDLLEQRDLDSNAPWYAYSRNQNLEIVDRKKLLIREMMPRAEFASDLKGEIAFCSGYSLIAERMTDEELKLWTAILCTPTMEFALRNNGTQLHSGWFRLLKHHLRISRIPRLNDTSYSKATELASNLHENPSNKKDWIDLDEIVSNAFGLSKDEHNYLQRFIKECHIRSISSDKISGDLDTQAEFFNRKSDLAEKTYDLKRFIPVTLNKYSKLHRERFDLGKKVTFQLNKEIPIHNWFSFTQGFSAPLVSDLLEELNFKKGAKILDPFVGSGTTLVTCMKEGFNCTGIEISPLMTWVSKVKTTHFDYHALIESLGKIKKKRFKPDADTILPFNDYLTKAFAPSILSQLCGILRSIEETYLDEDHKDFFKLAVISIMEEISQIRKHGSHYRYLLKSENIGLQKLNIQVIDPNSNITPIYFQRLEKMVQDVQSTPLNDKTKSTVICGDANNTKLSPKSFDGVITSPPYLNRNCYIAQQKAEMALLGFINNYQEYKDLVLSTFRSHVESRLDDEPVTSLPEIKKILDSLILSPKNNKKIPHMIAGYFEDLKACIKELARILRSNSLVSFVVGNSRWGGVVVPVDHILAMIAEEYGFDVEKILITRFKGNSPQQMRRYGRIPVRESVVIFRKP